MCAKLHRQRGGGSEEIVRKKPAPPPPRHCEEPLRRSNPESFCGEILDCFAALAMTTWNEVASPH
ncbi:hypothetical protein CWO91_26130 [Bradyrhizobium genosp. SA-3]|nr:hypothetical protein CWO91_26130 [Bradyrhizobium genosp. SA-3]